MSSVNKTNKALLGLLVCLLSLFCCGQLMATNSPEQRRLRAGLDLFPSFLAADSAIKSKTAADGKLHIALIFRDNARNAEKLAERLRQVGSIKSIPLEIQIIELNKISLNKDTLAGIFITQPKCPQLQTLVEYGKQHSIITFSPFAGDVAQGISGGISIKARILPQINITTLQASALQLKEFFLRIAIQSE